MLDSESHVVTSPEPLSATVPIDVSPVDSDSEYGHAGDRKNTTLDIHSRRIIQQQTQHGILKVNLHGMFLSLAVFQ